jgi:hypothetical protein
MSTANAITIGTAIARSRSPEGERRPPTREARCHARTPIPRQIPHEFYPTPPEARHRYCWAVWIPEHQGAALLVPLGRQLPLNGHGRYRQPSLLDSMRGGREAV